MSVERPASPAARRTSESVACGTPKEMLAATVAAEEKSFLRDEANVAAEFGGRELAQVNAVEEYATLGGIEQARDQADQSAFAAAGVADDSDGFRSRDEQIDGV